MIDDLGDGGDLVNIGTVVDEDDATNFDKLGVHLRGGGKRTGIRMDARGGLGNGVPYRDG